MLKLCRLGQSSIKLSLVYKPVSRCWKSWQNIGFGFCCSIQKLEEANEEANNGVVKNSGSSNNRNLNNILNINVPDLCLSLLSRELCRELCGDLPSHFSLLLVNYPLLYTPT